MGFERLTLKNDKLSCFFLSNPQSPFYESAFFQRMLQYVSIHGAQRGFRFKKSLRHFMLLKDGVKSLTQTRRELEGLLLEVERKVEAV
jgi:transcription-repair coupling factor (superfamily II helicase)